MKSRAVWIIPFSWLIVGGAWLGFPDFSVSLNQLCEMVYTGGVRGLMMFFYSGGHWSILFSSAAGVLASLVPIFKPWYVWQANVEFWGISGYLISLISTVLAILYGFGTGRLLFPFAKKCTKNLSDKTRQMLTISGSILLCTICPIAPAILGGILLQDFRKALGAGSIFWILGTLIRFFH